MTEKKKAYMKAWREANKNKIKIQQSAYREANIEKLKAYEKSYKEDKKHKPLVYLLPKENYVGTTTCIYIRMINHKVLGKNTDNYKILKRFENRLDALELERKMHDIGYKGKHINNSYK